MTDSAAGKASTERAAETVSEANRRAAQGEKTPDTGPRTPSEARQSNTLAEHAERLYVPWYSWLLPMFAAALMAATVHLGYPGVRAWLPYVVLVPLMAVLIWRAGRAPVRVEGDELHVGTAHLPLRHVGTVEVFGAKEKRKVLGPQLDPTAFVLHRGWVGPTVRVEVTDPEDPTPYWVFSTRHPEKIASLLRG